MVERQVPSPNFNERDPAVALAYIVLHYTGMPTAAAALQRMTDPHAEVSAHYMIDEAGDITALVDDNKRAWHAGKSFWRGITDMNSASIGIELVNPGHEFGYRAFPAAQIEALKTLLHAIVARHKLNPRTALLAHSDIAPQRKQDPGELFPWQELAQAGFGVWPEITSGDTAPPAPDEAKNLLSRIGYSCGDHDLHASLLAFQRRFVPESLTGAADQATMAQLRAVARHLIPSPLMGEG